MNEQLQRQIEFAAFLIQLGVVTAARVRSVFSEAGHDPETLAAIMAEVDQRLARRA